MCSNWVTRLQNTRAPAELHGKLCKHCLRSVDSAHLRVLRFLRVARALRSIRVMRLVHYIGALRTLVHLVFTARVVLPECYTYFARKCSRRFVSAQVLNREHNGQPFMDYATAGLCAAKVTERKAHFCQVLVQSLTSEKLQMLSHLLPLRLAGHDLLLVPWHSFRKCCDWGCWKSSSRDVGTTIADLHADIKNIPPHTYMHAWMHACIRIHT